MGLLFHIFISMEFKKIFENEEEDGMKGVKAQYDLAIKPQKMDSALKALDNIQNYGIYAQNLRDPETIKKVFGPSIPAQKTGAAWKDWDSRSDEEKDQKIADIQSRAPEAYEQAKEKSQKKFDDWVTPGKDQTFDDYLKSLPGKQLPMEFYGRYGKNYFPMKTPDNLKKYAGKLVQDVNFVVQDGLIIFLSTLENPFNTKPYLTKVLKTIMDNAELEYEIVKVERDTDGEREPEQIDTKKKDTVPPLSITKDTRDEIEKIRGIFQKEIGEVPTARYEIEPVENEEGRKYKLTVTGLSKGQRDKLFAKKVSLNEELEFEKKRLMFRAGIIK